MSAELEFLRSALADRYRIERELGGGGMATVYLAEDLRHGRYVAIKVLHPELAASLGSERFHREVEVTARLEHPNIVPLLDSGEHEGRLFYVMPFVKGETLRERLDRERQLPLRDVVDIAEAVAAALAHAHAQGVVHRDIKPANILLSDGAVRVADFGIARSSSDSGDDALTRTGMTIGSPKYMSPEQAMGEPDIDARTDVYSLACVVYEMLTGESPFSGATPEAIIARKLVDKPRSLLVVRDAIPEPVEEVILRGLARTRADRPASVASWASQLRKASLAKAGREAAPRRYLRAAKVGAFGVLALVGWGLWALLAGPPEPSASADQIVVFPFDATGDPEVETLGAQMVTLLGTTLDGVGGLRIVEPRRLMSALQLREAGDYDPARVAVELGAELFITGSITQAGGQLRLQARLSSMEESEPALTASVTGTLDEPFGLVDRLTSQLITGWYSGPTRGLDALGSNVDALKAYLRGEQAYLAFDDATAFEAFDRALALDSGFALAAYRGAMARYRFAAPTGLALELIEVARRSPERLGPVTPAHLEMLEGHILGHHDVVERATSEILRTRRDDPDVWHYRGEAFYHLNALRGRPFEEALGPFTRVLAIEPGYAPALRHLTELALRRGDRAALDTLLGARAEMTPGSAMAWWLDVQRHAASGDDESFRRTLSENPFGPNWLAELSQTLMTQTADPSLGSTAAAVARETITDPEALAGIFKYQAYLAQATGRLADAEALLDSLAALDAPSAVIHRSAFRMAPFREELPTRLPPDAAALVALDLSDVPGRSLPAYAFLENPDLMEAARLHLLGISAASSGDDATAEVYAERLDRLELSVERGTIASDLAAGVRAEVARHAGDPEEVLAALEEAQRYVPVVTVRESPFATQVRERFLQAEALAALGRTREALDWLGGIMAPWMQYDVAYYAPAVRRRAELHESLGELDMAATLYREFIELWRDADPELQVTVEEARTRLAALERGDF